MFSIPTTTLWEIELWLGVLYNNKISYYGASVNRVSVEIETFKILYKSILLKSDDHKKTV